MSALLSGLLYPLAAIGDTTDVSVSDADVVTDASPVMLEFSLTRGGDTSFDAFIGFHTEDGTAAAGTDYTATSGVVKIPAGDTSATIPVTVAANTAFRPDLTFSMLLDDVTGVGPAPSFATQQPFTTDGSPFAVTTADVNGDGQRDLIAANQSNNTVSVLLNTTLPGAATPAFAAQQSFATGDGPRSVTAADVNGDGRPDLIVANELSDTVSVLLNTTAPGAATPAFAAQQSFVSGDNPTAVTAADVNGDGRLDLVVANLDSDTVSVLLNTAAPGATTPAFAAQQTFATGSSPHSITATDINGDGRPDLLVANFNSNTVSVLLNSTVPGATTPAFATQQTFATGDGPTSVTAAEVNGDGQPDLIVANLNSNTVSVLLNTTAPGAATPAFAAQQTFAIGGSFSVTTSDVNGDGTPDLIAANLNSNTISVLLNTTAPGAATPAFAAQQSFVTGDAPAWVTAADVNGDGRPDLVAANASSNSVSVLLNTTPPGAATSVLAVQQTFATGSFPTSVTTTDVNGDGKSDLIVPNEDNNSISVLINTAEPGATTATFAAQQAFATGSSPQAIATADVNADGRPDVVVTNLADANVSVLINTTAPGAATPAFAARQNFATGSSPRSVAAADVNGDGRADLIVVNSIDTNVSVLLNTTPPGAATPSFAARQNFAVGSIPVSVAAADLNGDGRPDLAVANSEVGTVSVLLNTTAPGAATPSFAAQETFATDDAPFSVMATDVNGDGRPDLATANFQSDTVSVLLNVTAPGAATPVFAAQQTFGTAGGPYSVTAADMTGDGRSDLVVTSLDSNSVLVLPNATAPGAAMVAFSAQQSFVTGSFPIVVTTTDANGDGLLDAVVANFQSNTVSVMLNTRYQVTLGGSPATGTLRAPPSVASILRADPDSTNAVSVSWNVTFTEPVSGVDVADFALAVADLSGAAITGITGGDDAYTVTANTGNGDGTLGLNLVDDDSITGVANGVPLGNTDSGDFTGAVYTIDRVAPTVTINQGVAQVDPADTSPVVFDVIFSEAVTGLDASDVVLGGTAGATTAAVSGSGSSYTVSISGMIANGTVIASMPATAAQDGIGNTSLASTSTDNQVTFQGITPAVGLAPAILGFGDIEVGQAAVPGTVTVTNTGDANLNLGSLALSGTNAAEFSIQNDTCSSQTLGPGGNCSFDVGFTPAATGARVGQVDIPSNAPSSPDAVGLSGEGVNLAELLLMPVELDFGDHPLGQPAVPQMIVIENIGAGQALLGSLALQGPAQADYSVTMDGCSGQTLSTDEFCGVEIGFTASTAGLRGAHLRIPSNAPDNPHFVELIGTNDVLLIDSFED